MAFIRKRRPWTSQPQEAVELRRDTTIGASIRSLILPSLGPIDLALPPRPITKNANTNASPSDDGIAYSSADANSGLHFSGGFGNIVSTSEPITFFARVYVTATGVRRVIAADWSGAGASQSCAIEVIATDQWRMHRYDGLITVSGGAVTLGWHTVVASYNTSGGGSLWVDGLKIGDIANATARPSGTSAAWLDSGAYSGGIGWSTNKASLMAIGEMFADDKIAKEFHDSPWSALFAPKSIWVPVSAGGGPTPAGTAAETDASLTLSGVQLRAVGQAAETDAAQALVAVQIAVTGRADETETALALTPVQITVAGLASETDTALALDAGAASAAGIALETDAALALAAVQITATGIATEVDTALALTGLAGTAPGIASETDTAFALAAVQKLVAGAALEVDTALALSAPGGTLDLILKILTNRQELNPATGTFTLYDDDGTTVLYTTNAWADAAGTTPYSGGALRRIDALF